MEPGDGIWEDGEWISVSISADFEFQSRLFERSELRGATGKLLRIALPNAGGEG